MSNKFHCAKQNVSLGSPQNIPPAAAEKFCREALFALADAQYLLESFWREIAYRYNLEHNSLDRAFIDYSAGELWIEEN
ncbi:hypothetical protein NO1_0740 [Candidatus Termititenax aidoneus]|uniref:Uncharacterized protein n=1 Tax=Termititenax aidoneus TaxID=2218524 RepID=A0A388TAZ5_TERA1|nr:hypothetical protein NO1_0740 [Candidatus Termititenax aidoneus]